LLSSAHTATPACSENPATLYTQVLGMPRRARLAIPGISWHLILRGNNRTACFYEFSDYRYFLEIQA